MTNDLVRAFWSFYFHQPDIWLVKLNMYRVRGAGRIYHIRSRRKSTIGRGLVSSSGLSLWEILSEWRPDKALTLVGWPWNVHTLLVCPLTSSFTARWWGTRIVSNIQLITNVARTTTRVARTTTRLARTTNHAYPGGHHCPSAFVRNIIYFGIWHMVLLSHIFPCNLLSY